MLMNVNLTLVRMELHVTSMSTPIPVLVLWDFPELTVKQMTRIVLSVVVCMVVRVLMASTTILVFVQQDTLAPIVSIESMSVTAYLA